MSQCLINVQCIIQMFYVTFYTITNTFQSKKKGGYKFSTIVKIKLFFLLIIR